MSNQLKKLGNDTWFTLGDKDLATHIHRTNSLKQGLQLSDITNDLAKHFSILFKLIPMSNDTVKTMVNTPDGILPFQEYFVKRRWQDTVISVAYEGIKKSRPAPGVLEAIDTADVIIIAPSNPIVSIGTILAVPKIRKHIRLSKAKKIAISPIVGGKAIKGPADRMLKDLGIEPSAFGVAEIYKDFLDKFIIDTQDKTQKEKIEKLGICVVVTNTIMRDLEAKKNLAQIAIDSSI